MKTYIFLAIGVLCILTLLAFLQEEPVSAVQSNVLSTPDLIFQDLENGTIDQDTANLYLTYALSDYSQLPTQYQSSVPWDGTPILIYLQENFHTMNPGTAKFEVQSLLATPCDGGTQSNSSTHFNLMFSSIGGGLNATNYLNTLETSWQKEITQFGWAAPPIISTGGKYKVLASNLGSGLYGYVQNFNNPVNNPNTSWNDVDAYESCMVLNNNYSSFGNAQKALEATVAHEFNHSIQFGYGVLFGSNVPDESFVEGGATWIEDEVFDASNDNYNYLWPTFSMCMGQYINSPYPYWITIRGLTERFGTGNAGGGEQVMQDFWEILSKNQSSNLMFSALNTALKNKGTNLADAYHAYAIAVKFNKPCSGGYAYPYCFEEGNGYVSLKGSPQVNGAISTIGSGITKSVADYYSLNWISMPTGGQPYDISIKNNSNGGELRVSIVCDTGSTLKVSPLPSIVGGGETNTLDNYNPSGCSSVIAVVTNQSQTQENPISCSTRSYTLSTKIGTTMAFKLFLPNVITTNNEPPNPIEPIRNGDFEDGQKEWSENSSHSYVLIDDFLPISPHGGDFAAWLGGDDNENSYIQQQVTVPSNSPYLNYWRWINSIDNCGYDFGGVIINGNQQIDWFDLCKNTGGWQNRSVNLSTYAGQSITLRFQAITDSINLSSLFIDDVSFISTPRFTDENFEPTNPTSIYRKPDHMLVDAVKR